MPSKLSASLIRSLSTNMDQSTLVLTQIIFRHGHRSPDETIQYPGDPYVNEPYLPFGKGELTLIGRKQCFALGQALRARYHQFLGPEYRSGIVDAKSSEVSRARTTLQLVLAGLFPPSSSTHISDELNWQPVPFTYRPIKEDALIGRAIANLHQHKEHPDFRSSPNSRAVIACIEEQLNWDVRTQAQCLLVYDTVKTQVDVGLAMPRWCADIYPEKLRLEVESFATYNFGRKRFLVDGYGHMVREVSEVMARKAEERLRGVAPGLPKMFLYSGHDINLIGLLSIFKRFDATRWPNYAANLTFELHQVGSEFYVQILYQNGPDDARDYQVQREHEVITLPDVTTDMCTLDEFAVYVREYFPDQAVSNA